MSHLSDVVIDVVLSLILDSVLDSQVSNFFRCHLVLLGLDCGSWHHFYHLVMFWLYNGRVMILRL